MSNKFLLLLGPSGTGKSTIVNRLKELDDRFVYISPYITRRLRVGEQDKISVTKSRLEKLNREGKLLTINKLYGVSYATPREPIEKAFLESNFPILDWPINKLHIMEVAFPGKLFRVYLEPPSLDALKIRLSDGRDPENKRLFAAKDELARLLRGDFDKFIDFKIVNDDGKADVVAKKILDEYLRAIKD